MLKTHQFSPVYCLFKATPHPPEYLISSDWSAHTFQDYVLMQQSQ